MKKLFIIFFIFSTLVFSASKPDLKVLNLNISRIETRSALLRLDVKISISNSGKSISSENIVARVYYRIGQNGTWNQLHDFSILGIGENKTREVSKNFDFNEAGNYYIKVEVDPDNQIDELSESNNTKIFPKFFEAGIPDIIISNLKAEIIKENTSGSKQIKVEWDIENICDGTVKESFVTVLYMSNNNGPFSEVQRYTKSNLKPGQKFHITKTLTHGDFRSLRFKVVADETKKVFEKTSQNNTEVFEILSQ